METTVVEDGALPDNLRRVIRELIIAAAALLAGLLAVPLLIYLVGHSILGPYAHGGPGRLLGDFFAGLAHGDLAFWSVALGPYVMTLLVRLLYFLARRRS
ncbi:MAG TPA: hypothetical protein VII70_06680 [Steroidobacteraceae bacterium]